MRKVFPKDHIESAMKTVFQMNVMRYQGGFMGAVNGMRPDGRVFFQLTLSISYLVFDGFH